MNQSLIHQITEQEILQLADSMAAAATSFNSHGYEIFIQSRDDFKTALHNFASTNQNNQNIKKEAMYS